MEDQAVYGVGGGVEPVPDQQVDPLLYRMVVGSLGLAVLGAIVGVFVLALLGRATPEGLISLGSVAAGGLVGLLAPSPNGK